jgi:hypothetical protein
MRKALIGILMAATAATPLAAQDGGWRGHGHNGEDRAQRIEQRNEARQQRSEAPRVERQQVQQVQQTQRVERVQAEQPQRFEGRGNWGGRRQMQEQQPAQVQVQQQAQVRSERWQGGNNGGNWGRDARRDGNSTGYAADRSTGYTDRNVQDRSRYEQQRTRTDWQQNRRGDNRWDGNRRDGNRYSSGQRFNRNNWSRSWRNNSRYDWQRYRYQNRSIFNLGRYYAPYGGYGYNRLSIGIILGEAFFGRDYWIDPYYYHLPPAPEGTEWVRYYNDVVLVDMYSGEVIDVIYDFFW